MKSYDLIGIGAGPFHLSLAALMTKVPSQRCLFLDQKPFFQWHQELMFNDADMQTSFLKDLVTPVDPTNPHSFLNYLVQNGLFYSFMNTGRKVVTRKEFELYCQWVSKNISDNLKFNTTIEEVHFDKDHFVIKTNGDQYTSKNISVATGLVPRVPDFAMSLLGENVFHAKSGHLHETDMTNKRVLIIGGGQTGVEVFRNCLHHKWGKVKNVKLISRRKNLEPLDESPFTNEFFTPGYVNEFFDLDQDKKDPIVKSQKLASDGNTPSYLDDLFKDLYQIQHVRSEKIDFKILPCRDLVGLNFDKWSYRAQVQNRFADAEETFEADIIVLCTGFKNVVPKMLEPIYPMLNLDTEGRFIIKRNFDLDWKGPATNKIYALNFSRHRHGIAEPQTSLMAWRSASIINDMTGSETYKTVKTKENFIQYGKID